MPLRDQPATKHLQSEQLKILKEIEQHLASIQNSLATVVKIAEPLAKK